MGAFGEGERATVRSGSERASEMMISLLGHCCCFVSAVLFCHVVRWPEVGVILDYCCAY